MKYLVCRLHDLEWNEKSSLFLMPDWNTAFTMFQTGECPDVFGDRLYSLDDCVLLKHGTYDEATGAGTRLLHPAQIVWNVYPEAGFKVLCEARDSSRLNDCVSVPPVRKEYPCVDAAVEEFFDYFAAKVGVESEKFISRRDLFLLGHVSVETGEFVPIDLVSPDKGRLLLKGSDVWMP